MKVPLRFSIRTPEGVEPLPRHPSPEAVLSKALTLACRSEAPGVWEVVEYEDVVYRVHRTAERSLHRGDGAMMAEDILAIFGVCCLSVGVVFVAWLCFVAREQLR